MTPFFPSSTLEVSGVFLSCVVLMLVVGSMCRRVIYGGGVTLSCAAGCGLGCLAWRCVAAACLRFIRVFCCEERASALKQRAGGWLLAKELLVCGTDPEVSAETGRYGEPR